MALHDDLFRRLDKKAFLGFRVWDFSFRSLPHRYGIAFLREVVLRFPLRTLTGLLSYRRMVKGSCREGDITRLFQESENDFQQRVALSEGSFLVAVGFCQKTMKDSGVGNECPAGRFNHHCLYLAQLDLSKTTNVPLACQECDIRLMGTKALAAAAKMHIMTSALDILHDIFVPSLEQKRFTSGIFSVCPYSVHPIILPLHICGIEGLVVQFNSGYCVDYNQWSLADGGMKNERTFMSPGAQNEILDFLDGVAEIRAELRKPVYHRFRLEGNFYEPA